MKSATSFFNRGVFLKTVARFWPIWAIYTFVQLLVLPMNITGMLGGLGRELVNRAVLEAAAYTAQYICPTACCAAAMAVFSHLYSDRAAGFYAALPVGRGAMFVSVSLAGLTPLLAANVLAFLAALATEAAFGFSGVPALLEWLGAVTLMTVAYFGIAAFCAQLTGHLVVMPVLFIAFGVVVSLLGNMALVVPEMFCYGYASAGAGIADLFSPFVCFAQNVYIVQTGQGVYGLGGWQYLIAYGLAGLALLPASLALYTRRDMESAGDVVAIAPLRPVFQLVCAFAAAFILGNALFTLPFGDNPADGVLPATGYAMCMAAAAFIGWFGSAMIVNKTFAVFENRNGYIAWAVVSLLCAALVLTCELDVTGYETRVPTAADVASVSVNAGGANVSFREPENIAAAIAVHESAIAAREENENARALGRARVWCSIDYTLKNGDELRREYSLAQNGESDVTDLLQALMNTDEGISGRKDPGTPMNESTVAGGEVRTNDYSGGTEAGSIELSAAEALELYHTCILPDMRDRTIGLVWFRTDDTYYESVYDCRISIYVETGNGSWMEFYTVPTIWSERTNAWLEEHGVELKTLAGV